MQRLPSLSSLVWLLPLPFLLQEARDRPVHVLCRKAGQHRQPPPHVVALRVVLAALFTVVDHVPQRVPICSRQAWCSGAQD